MHIFVQKKKKCLRRFSRGHICTHLCRELGACIYFVRIIITINFIHRIHICTNTPSISLSSSPSKGTKSMHKYLLHPHASDTIFSCLGFIASGPISGKCTAKKIWPLSRSMLMFCTEMRSKRFCNGNMFGQARQRTNPSSPKEWKYQFKNMESMALK